MPRKRGSGDGALYYLKARKLWRGVVDAGYWPDGRRRQAYVHDRDAKECRRKLDQLKMQIEKTGTAIDTRTTVAQWADHWLVTIKQPQLKPSALAGYESSTRKWVVATIGTRRVSAVKPSDIRLVLKAAKDGGLASSSALTVFNIMSGMFEDARREGLCMRNVVKDVEPPKASESGRGALPEADTLAILRTAGNLADGTRWWAALFAGLRQSERLGATIDSIDWERGTLNVQWELEEVNREHGCGGRGNGKWPCGFIRGASCPQARFKLPDGIRHRHLKGRLFLIPPKSNKARTVPLMPELVEALKRYLAATDHLPNPHGLIWRHPDGSPIVPGDDNDAWASLLFAAGVITAEQAKRPKDREPGTPEPPTTHWARHTTVTMLRRMGVHTKVIGEIVGHADMRITERVYDHVSSDDARDAMTLQSDYYREVFAPQKEIEQ
jgi:integrase